MEIRWLVFLGCFVGIEALLVGVLWVHWRLERRMLAKLVETEEDLSLSTSADEAELTRQRLTAWLVGNLGKGEPVRAALLGREIRLTTKDIQVWAKGPKNSLGASGPGGAR